MAVTELPDESFYKGVDVPGRKLGWGRVRWWLCCDKYIENKADREQDNYSLALRVHFRAQLKGTFSFFFLIKNIFFHIGV